MKHPFLYSLGFLACLALGSCEDNRAEPYDNPFVYICDQNGATSYIVDKASNNLATDIYVYLSTADFQSDITINYELIVGNGLIQGKDFSIKNSSLSPLSFSPGTYQLPIRIVWFSNPNLVSTNDNTLTFRLSSTTPEMIIGHPGPDGLRKEYKFTRK